MVWSRYNSRYSGISGVLEILINAEIKEAAIGIEPMDKGFADLCLTTWLRRLRDSNDKAKASLNSFGFEIAPSP
jgi:hypothetical protein